jgi:hypothetical protein
MDNTIGTGGFPIMVWRGRVARSSASYEAATSSRWRSCAIFSTRTSSSAPTRFEVFSAWLSALHLARFSVLDGGVSIVPIPPACRRAVRSSRTPAPHRSRLLEAPQALPVFEPNLSTPGCQLCHPLLQLPVLVFQLLQPLGLAAIPRRTSLSWVWENSHSRLI